MRVFYLDIFNHIQIIQTLYPMPKGEIVFKNGDFYQGQLKNDEPNGRGVYKFKNKSQYEGQFKDGKFNGRGRLVDSFNQLIITGQFVQGNAQGRCKIEYGDGSIYQGQVKQGFRWGKGVLTFGGLSSQKMYKGWFVHDQMEGQGELTFKNGDIYRGKFVQSNLEGEAEMLTQHFSYVGQVKGGLIEGKGSIKYSSGDLYQGQFQMCQKHGYGKYTYADGSIYQGQWDHDQRKGKGKLLFTNGDTFEGLFEEQAQEGLAKWGEWKIQGQLKDSQFEGNIKMLKPGTVIEASFEQGYHQGLMKIEKKVKHQTISYRGQFERGHQKPYSVSYSKRI